MIDADEPVKSTLDYLGIFKRRKLSLLVPALATIALTLVLAFGLPSMYQSTATILIQGQTIPQDFVRSTITSYASEQVTVIRHQVLTVENITNLAEKYKLYQEPDSDFRLPSTELAELFEENVSLELVSADIVDPRSGRASQVVIAFTLGFTDPSTVKAQKVTSELTTMFMDTNLRFRTERATGAVDFFGSESILLNTELLELEEELAEFKLLNEGSLPEQYNFNLATLDRTHREMSDVKLRIQMLEERKIELASQLVQLSPSAVVVLPTGEVVLSDEDRLKALQSDYRRKSAIYSASHPDVLRLSNEIQALQAELGLETDIDDLRRQLQEQQQHLSQLQGKYTDEHQEIQNTKKIVALLETTIRTASSTPVSSNEPEPDNPAYILLETQLDTTISEIGSLSEKQVVLEDKIAQYEMLMERAPNVEKDYQALLRDYNNATSRYQDIKTKEREATIARNLERDRKGQRFVLLEPAVLPIDPVSPNRPAIIFLGFVLATGAGLGFGLIREVMDGSIHGAAELTAVMGEAPLVTIPYIDNDNDIQAKQRIWKISLVTAITAGVLFIVFIHFFYKPLDVLYFVILRKLGFS